MALLVPVRPVPTVEVKRRAGPSAPPPFSLEGSLLATHAGLAKSRGATAAVSIGLHSLLVLAVFLLPLLWTEELPAPDALLRAFFVAPPTVMAPPPPPPPPAPSRVAAKTPPPVPRAAEAARFVAPIEVPNTVAPEEEPSFGVEGGVPGGVEGGVPGGVVGGIVGGLPAEAPPSAPVVRVGGHIHPPKLVHKVEPVYPSLALEARLSMLVILEAQVDIRGQVKSVRVLRGHPLFDDAALAAVKQWRYQPLLLNGTPTEFILTVTLQFTLQTAPLP
jgi:protein TonB